MIMVGSSIHTLRFFSLSLLVVSLVTLSDGRSVNIKNYLRNDLLSILCRSEDKHLGMKVLNYERELTLPIEAKISKTSTFTCNMEWNGRIHKLDVFNSERDGKVGKDLKWSIQNDRPCLWNYSTNKYDLCKYSYS
ncbi:unnamed protein product [Lupinus luteus]|uniref:S-protein homolog n=1 Tax=Lupinus luteus TaxID=3873 RepID=A0AAV1WAN3_LUPLU